MAIPQFLLVGEVFLNLYATRPAAIVVVGSFVLTAGPNFLVNSVNPFIGFIGNEEDEEDGCNGVGPIVDPADGSGEDEAKEDPVDPTCGSDEKEKEKEKEEEEEEEEGDVDPSADAESDDCKQNL